jgi:hypothetical protein
MILFQTKGQLGKHLEEKSTENGLSMLLYAYQTRAYGGDFFKSQMNICPKINILHFEKILRI